jgi:hypothetical protein
LDLTDRAHLNAERSEVVPKYALLRVPSAKQLTGGHQHQVLCRNRGTVGSLAHISCIHGWMEVSKPLEDISTKFYAGTEVKYCRFSCPYLLYTWMDGGFKGETNIKKLNSTYY